MNCQITFEAKCAVGNRRARLTLELHAKGSKPLPVSFTMSIATPEAPSASAPDKDEAASLENSEKPRRARGFAAMDRTRQKEIARKGGRAAHARGTAHRFDTDEAREAGRKGGAAV